MHITRLFFRSFILLAALSVIGGVAGSIANAQESSAEREKVLLAVLRSDAPGAEKAISCKLLAIHGSSEAVPELAKLLPDPQLSSWARIALESIPGAEADEALRTAAGSLDGLLLVGMINSIGVRRDAEAVEPLAARLQDKDVQVASAAAVALGRIGNAAATKSLRAALSIADAKVRSSVAEGCVLCAERLLAAGDSAEAIAIYDQIRNTELPQQRIIEATRGTILARKQDGLPLLIELFKSPDKRMFQLALGIVRIFPGGEVDKALAAQLATVKPARAALMITAMGARPDTVVLPAILNAAAAGPKQVRLAAIDAIGRVGDASCVSILLDAALDTDADLAQAAEEALANLPSDKVDAQIAALLPKAEGNSLPLLINLVGKRRIAAVPALLKALEHSDKTVRVAALLALGETVSLDRISVLIKQVISPKDSADLPVAEQALKAASVRMPDREACAAELASAYKGAPALKKTIILEILSDVGGTKALQTLASAAKSADPESQDAASRLLGKWNSVDAAPVLLDLAKTAPTGKYRVRSLRGYIGLARKFTMPEPERVAMCEKAFAASTNVAERILVLEVLKLKPSGEGLRLAIKAMEVPALKAAATQATLLIAQKIGKGADIALLLKKAGLEKVKLEIVKAEYGSGSTQKDVTTVLRKHAGDSPLIVLPGKGFNASFGGDPAPGTVKKLKIQYRINDKDGTASFAEDVLIVLPVPK
ncbi:MAG: HEAT repeat protein [Pirellulaceae bacterium]|jgi:HEAT repeat protein